MKYYEKTNAQLKIRVTNLSKDGRDKILDMFTLEVKEVAAMMPIFLALGNKDLKPRHMKKIFDLLSPSFNSSKNYSF